MSIVTIPPGVALAVDEDFGAGVEQSAGIAVGVTEGTVAIVAALWVARRRR